MAFLATNIDGNLTLFNLDHVRRIGATSDTLTISLDASAEPITVARFDTEREAWDELAAIAKAIREGGCYERLTPTGGLVWSSEWSALMTKERLAQLRAEDEVRFAYADAEALRRAQEIKAT